jgi:Zn-dependent M28 family amino/carboxypeptidase
MRTHRITTTTILPVILAGACLGACQTAVQQEAEQTVATSPTHVLESLSALAHDSMMGRRTGTEGAARAARFIAARMQTIGLTPAGDSGFIQRVPLARITRNNRPALALLSGPGALDTIPAEQRVTDANVIGLIRGSDPELREEAILVGAHFDHIGIVTPVAGDSIANGADDDASGVVAVLEIARALAHGPAPRRTVIFAAFTGEEMGGLGSRHYMANPPMPLERTVAQLQIEMIGRPDSLVGGHGRAWLTGYERSTMGPSFAAAGLAVHADPRPDQSFFTRSDNIRFARAGIPAHTLSSFNLHRDYHRPSDEVTTIDIPHMTAVIDIAIRAVRLLADGPRPEWVAGGRPE